MFKRLMFKNLALLLSVLLFSFCFYSLYAEKTPVFGEYSERYELYLQAGSFGDNIAYATKDTFKDFTSVKGESCIVNVPYGKVLSDFSATHEFSERTDSGTSYYAYSPLIKYKVYVKGRAVNIHYYAAETYNKLGTPLIFGSF